MCGVDQLCVEWISSVCVDQLCVWSGSALCGVDQLCVCGVDQLCVWSESALCVDQLCAEWIHVNLLFNGSR